MELPHKLKVIGECLKGFKLKILSIVIFLLLAGILEAFGFAALLPVIEIFFDESTNSDWSLISQIPNISVIMDLFPNQSIALILLVSIAFWIKAALLYISASLVGITASEFVSVLREKIFESVIKAPYRTLLAERHGRIATSIISEADRAGMLFKSCCQLATEVVLTSAYFILAFYSNPPAAITMVLIGILLFVTLFGFVKKSKKSGQIQTDANKRLVTELTELLSGIKVLKSMRLSEHLGTLIRKSIQDIVAAVKVDAKASAAVKVLYEPIIITVLCASLIFFASSIDLNAPEFILLAILFQRIMSRTSVIQKIYQGSVLHFSALKSTNELITSLRIEPIQEKNLLPLERVKSVKFKNVHLKLGQYSLIEGLNFEFDGPGFFVIEGQSGSGKSTTLDLLSGLLEPTEGEVQINNIKMKDLSSKDFKDQIGVVVQDTVLFNDTLLNNVKLGREELTNERIEILFDSMGRDFKNVFTNGLASEIFEGGRNLSGGQKQRVALMRAMAHEPSLLICDEATSALDQRTEKRIFDLLKDYSQRHLVVVCSHSMISKRYSDKTIKITR